MIKNLKRGTFAFATMSKLRGLRARKIAALPGDDFDLIRTRFRLNAAL